MPNWVLELDFQYFGAIASILALLLTLLVYIRVQSIAKSRKEEQVRIYRTLNIELLQNTLQHVNELLADISASKGLNFEQRKTLNTVRDELIGRNREFAGTLRALRQYSGDIENGEQLKLVSDYYSTKFMVEKISGAKDIIRIVCVRALRVTHTDILRALTERIEKGGVNVEIMALSPSAPSNVIEAIIKALPSPTPKSVEDYIEDMIRAKKHIKQEIGALQRNKDRFCYYEFRVLPLIHMVQVDDSIYLGFQYFKRSQDSEPLRNHCLKIPSSSVLGKSLLFELNYVKTRDDTKTYTF